MSSSIHYRTRDRYLIFNQRWAWPCLTYLPPVGVSAEIPARKGARNYHVGLVEYILARGRCRVERTGEPCEGCDVGPPLVKVVPARHMAPVRVVNEEARTLVQPTINHLAAHTGRGRTGRAQGRVSATHSFIHRDKSWGKGCVDRTKISTKKHTCVVNIGVHQNRPNIFGSNSHHVT